MLFQIAHGKMTAHDLSFQIQFASPTFRNPIFIFHLLSFCPYFQKPMTSICLNPPLLLVFIAPKLFVLTFQVCFISYFLFLFRHTSSLFLSLTVLTPLFLNFPIWLWTRLIIVSVKEFVFIMFFLSSTQLFWNKVIERYRFLLYHILVCFSSVLFS